MTEKEIIALQIWQKYQKKDDFLFFLNYCERLLNISDGICQYLEKHNYSDDELETITALLFVKYYKQAKSLFATFKIFHNSQSYYDADLSTIYILLRVLLENYLTYYYLFVETNNKTERNLRYNIFKLSSYIVRQKYETKDETLNIMKESEKNLLTKLQTEIKNDPVYQSYDKRVKDQIMEGYKPRLISWEKLIKQADFNDNVRNSLKNGWSNNSNHAHSDYWSLVHTKYYLNDINKLYETKFALIFQHLCVTSKYLWELSKQYNGLTLLLNNKTKDMDVIEIFKMVYSK